MARVLSKLDKEIRIGEIIKLPENELYIFMQDLAASIYTDKQLTNILCIFSTEFWKHRKKVPYFIKTRE